MASLVNYGVESDRDSDDDSSREKSPEVNLAKPQTAPKKDKKSAGSSDHDLVKSSKSNKVQSSSSNPSRHHHSKEKKHHKHHKRSRSRSRSRDRREKRKGSREREKEHRHHKDDRKKRRSRSRSRSRSSDRDRRSNRRTRSQERREKKAATIERMGLDVSALAASVAASGKPQPDHQKTNKIPSAALEAAQHAAAAAAAAGPVPLAQPVSASLPTFYNPAAVNVVKYTQQIQKRKLLWANKKEEAPNTSTAKMLGATAFTQDQDGKMTAKFKRLMGIKQDQEVAAAGPSEPAAGTESEVLKKQQELFASLDQQYQIARATTHTQRGLGLGFSSNNPR